ncbi:branched-chain amino acid ABC transporter permease [Neobacillus sp. 114]|uniref:branched-chain amino acid ABC transporter permease n=1 Tax=Neobacillus sp. 114 TaxID=3048535 RepID=UPI0024C20D82|nr:branched-chain amino acid ABC transporter permease [Neobacillus sp. 114]
MDYVLGLCIIIVIYIIGAMSFNLLLGHANIFSVAHAGFIGIGAYSTAIFTVKLGINFLGGMIVGILIAGVIGYIFALLTLRVSGDYMVVASFGLLIIFNQIFSNWTVVTNGGRGFPGIMKPELFGYPIIGKPEFLIFSFIILIVCYIIIGRLIESPFGRVLRAMGNNEVAAKSLGKNVVQYKILVFTVTGAIAAISGSLYAHYITFINPTDFNVHLTMFLLTIIIIAGTKKLWTVIIGAVFLVLVPEIIGFIHLPNSIAAGIEQLFYGLILVLFALLRPKGILSTKS